MPSYKVYFDDTKPVHQIGIPADSEGKKTWWLGKPVRPPELVKVFNTIMHAVKDAQKKHAEARNPGSMPNYAEVGLTDQELTLIRNAIVKQVKTTNSYAKRRALTSNLSRSKTMTEPKTKPQYVTTLDLLLHGIGYKPVLARKTWELPFSNKQQHENIHRDTHEGLKKQGYYHVDTYVNRAGDVHHVYQHNQNNHKRVSIVHRNLEHHGGGKVEFHNHFEHAKVLYAAQD